MSEEFITTPREELNGGESLQTTINQESGDTFPIDKFILVPSGRETMNIQLEMDESVKEEKTRTGINRKFDSIMLGITSSICFGLLAGAVVGLWAVPIGTIAGFYIAYKTYQDSAR